MLVDISVPEIGIDALTYESGTELQAGMRVIVEVVRTKRAGFVLGESLRELPAGVEAKTVEGVIDDKPIVGCDIWDLAMWSERVSMCGMSNALKAAFPLPFYTGEKVNPPPEYLPSTKTFRERSYFNPFDAERVNFFADELKQGMRTLVLFPRRDEAKSFFSDLPDTLKSEAILWPEESPKLWEAWKHIHSGEVRIVIAPPGGIFAPFSPEKIIVEDEANPAYVIPHTLNISARSLAGHRAQFLKAELILAGRIPSLKTYIRTHPRERLRPERRNIILADIHQSRKEFMPGIEGSIPLTYTLTSRTHLELVRGHNVIWILNRTGEASEVFCENCGESVKCPKCGGLMQARIDGKILKCWRCGMICDVPSKCDSCGYDILTGRRPGIDALSKIIEKYFDPVHVYERHSDIPAMKGLILSTNKGLELCGKIDPSLVAWLDIDSELWRSQHTNRYNLYTTLLESYWRGRTRDSGRKVLIQARRKGIRFAEFLAGGWTRFIPDELRSRQDFLLPPYGYIIEVGCSSRILRGKIMDSLMDAGFFVMDPDDEAHTLYVNTESVESVRKILEPIMFLRNTKSQYINITVRSE